MVKNITVWPQEYIGNIFDFKNGLNKAKEFFGSGIPIVNYVDVYSRDAIYKNTVKGRVDLTLAEINRFRVKRGDVFFTRTSETPEEVGIAAVLLEEISDCVFSGFVLRARPKKQLLLPEYCQYCFQTQQVRAEIILGCTYTTRALTNGTQLSKIQLPIPPLPEQKAIAEALSDIDHLIAAIEKLIGKKKDIKKGLMQELLTGKRRLAGFSNVWENVCLGDILKVCHGKSQHNVEVKVGSYPIWATSGKIGSASSYIWQYPSVLIGRKGTIDRPFYLETPFWCIDTIFYTKIKEQNCAKFIYYLFCTIDWLSMNEASGVPSLSAKRIEAITIQLPSYEEQKEIARVLSTIDNNISCLSVKLEKLRNIKQGMMNELLTGRIRLSEEKGHDEQFDDAVLISAIVNAFYTPQYPLGRKKVQKLLYLARRFQNAAPSGFLKKAAGPYKPSARYSGGEKIAQKSGYVTLTEADKGTLFAVGKNVEKAIEYAKKWDYLPAIDWLVQNFKYTKVDELEVLATVDMAICDLTAAGQEISVENIKSLIKNNAEWSPKLEKTYFSDTNIAAAINKSQAFFPEK